MRHLAEWSSSDIEGMSLDQQASDPAGYNGYQSPRDLASEPETDQQDPATSGGPAPYNGTPPFGRPVTTDPEWTDQQDPATKKPYSPMPYAGPGPGVDTTILHEARRGPTEETMTADLWTLASADAEADQAAARLVQAKVATASMWPFLAGAGSENEFIHRVALCQPQLERHFPEPGWRAQVTVALREDFRTLKGLSPKESASEGDREPTQPDGTAANPYYFAGDEPEAGPLTAPAESGHFAEFLAGPDPWNPMNAQYPMQPSPWTVPPDKAWVEYPMQGMHTGSAMDGGSGALPEEDEDNPGTNYFSGGQEGVAGDQQNGYPADISLPEPDERVDMYGAVPPQSSQAAPPQSYTNKPRTTGRFVLSERDNHGACAYGGCGGPVYRDGDTWKHLNGDPGHGVHLHQDHPWVRGQQAGRVMAAQHHAEYHYVKPNPDGEGFVITQKGTGKILSHHDTREDAESAFRAMMWSKHKGARGRWKVADLATGTDDSIPSAGTDTGGTDTTSAPDAPSSMTPGGAGAEAMPPLTIPNQNVTTNPFATGSPSSDVSTANATNPFQAVKTAEVQVRERPTSTNPLGVSDEYQSNTWDNPANQRPLQSSEDRNINTPQVPQQAIPVRSSDGVSDGQERDESDEGDQD